ncbi:MAG: hypothetical protein WCA21_14480 [Terracidiphilus sp.]
MAFDRLLQESGLCQSASKSDLRVKRIQQEIVKISRSRNDRPVERISLNRELALLEEDLANQPGLNPSIAAQATDFHQLRSIKAMKNPSV